ncbi:DUF3042 family protein [Furfurilactobacillus sp. WILCCON 0119]
MKSFNKGFLVGVIASLGAVVASLVSFHKTVITPIEAEEDRIDDNRRRALRKSRSSHQG